MTEYQVFLPDMWLDSGAREKELDFLLKELLKQDDPVYIQSRYNLRPKFISYCRKKRYKKGVKFTYK